MSCSKDFYWPKGPIIHTFTQTNKLCAILLLIPDLECTELVWGIWEQSCLKSHRYTPEVCTRISNPHQKKWDLHWHCTCLEEETLVLKYHIRYVLRSMILSPLPPSGMHLIKKFSSGAAPRASSVAAFKHAGDWHLKSCHRSSSWSGIMVRFLSVAHISGSGWARYV